MTSPELGLVSQAFAQAFVDAQGSIEGAIKGKSNPAFARPGQGPMKYADLRSCWEACKEALQENKIGVIQFPVQAAMPGHIGMLTMLVYGPSGETLGAQADFPLKDPTNAQATGSAITYARRYALCSVIGICPEDDDGNAASAQPKDRGTGSKAKQSEPAKKPSQDVLGYRTDFDTCSDISGKKSVYGKLKDEPDFPGKQELLAEFVETIKGLMPAKETK